MLSTSESSRGALASFAVSDLSSLSLSLLAHPPPLPAPPPKPPNQRPQVDLRELRKLAVVKGLGTNALRARAWPLLLGARAGADDLDVLQRLSSASSPSACSSDSDPDGGKRGPPPPPLHRDSAVVDVDVERSLWAFTRGWSEGAKASARAALRRVINASVAEASRELQGRAEAQEDGGNTERIGDEASAAEKLRQPRRKREASRSSSSSSLPEEEAESKGNGGRSGTGNDGRSGTGGGNGTGGGDGNGIGGGGVNSGASTVPGPPRRRLGPAPRHGQRGRGVPPAAEAGRLPAPRLHPADARRGARGVRPAPADRRQGRPAAREGLGQLEEPRGSPLTLCAVVAADVVCSQRWLQQQLQQQQQQWRQQQQRWRRERRRHRGPRRRRRLERRTLNSTARLFDLFAASHPIMPLYVAAAAIVADKRWLLAALAEGDPAEAHAALAKVRVFGVGGRGVAELAVDAHRLCMRHPPGSWRWRRGGGRGRRRARGRRPPRWRGSAPTARGSSRPGLRTRERGEKARAASKAPAALSSS